MTKTITAGISRITHSGFGAEGLQAKTLRPDPITWDGSPVTIHHWIIAPVPGADIKIDGDHAGTIVLCGDRYEVEIDDYDRWDAAGLDAYDIGGITLAAAAARAKDHIHAVLAAEASEAAEAKATETETQTPDPIRISRWASSRIDGADLYIGTRLVGTITEDEDGLYEVALTEAPGPDGCDFASFDAAKQAAIEALHEHARETAAKTTSTPADAGVAKPAIGTTAYCDNCRKTVTIAIGAECPDCEVCLNPGCGEFPPYCTCDDPKDPDCGCANCRGVLTAEEAETRGMIVPTDEYGAETYCAATAEPDDDDGDDDDGAHHDDCCCEECSSAALDRDPEPEPDPETPETPEDKADREARANAKAIAERLIVALGGEDIEPAMAALRELDTAMRDAESAYCVAFCEREGYSA